MTRNNMNTPGQWVLSLAMFLALAGLIGSCAPPRQSQEMPLPFPMPDVESASLRCALPPGSLPTERWIEVSLREQVVRLCEGEQVAGEYLAATGAGDRQETTTFPGLFAVREKNKGPIYLSEFQVYVSDWVGFDKEHDNGFHSLPMDKSGQVLDDRLGQPVSHGCVRTAQPADVYQFAEFGMKVWVH